jgi:hypothetical protein
MPRSSTTAISAKESNRRNSRRRDGVKKAGIPLLVSAVREFPLMFSAAGASGSEELKCIGSSFNLYPNHCRSEQIEKYRSAGGVYQV